MEEHNKLQINKDIISHQTKKIGKSKKYTNNLGKSIYEDYNLNKIGSIKFAKIHSSANRPLHKKKDVDLKNAEFCKCCNLPAEKEGIMERFKFFDDPDNFIECGEGVSLYFTFFKFAMIILIITFFSVSLCNIIFSKIYYDELYDLCNSNLKNLFIETDCELFSEEAKNTKSYSLISNSFFYMFNSINTKYYRNLYYNLTLNDNKNIENVIVNTSFLNFYCLITLFIFNIYFIIIIKSKSQNINMSILSLSDYSIYITHLNKILQLFLNQKKELEEKKRNAEHSKIEYDYQEDLYNILGIEKSLIESSELEQFISFLKNKVCVHEDGKKLDIKKVNICFKISKLMKLQEEVHKVDEKMSKIRNHPYQITKNEDLQLYGNKKKYFSSFLNLECCEKTETLRELKEQKKSLTKDIEELMEKSKQNILDYFGGCTIICVDTIAEHEKFLDTHSNNVYIRIYKFLKFIFCGCCFKKNIRDLYFLKRNIRFERAPEPEDIIYENLEYSNSMSRVCRIFFVYFFSFILIFICFIIVTALNYAQKYINKKKNYHIVFEYIISLFIFCCIKIIDVIFEKLLDFLTKKEKQPTTTDYYLSKSIKLTIFSFMNHGIIPLISEIYNQSKGYEYLIINMFMIFLINSIIVPISWTISFSYIYKKISIWLIEKDIDPDDPDANHEKTQKELNDLYELPSMDVAEKYSYIFKTLLITFFYIQIFPLGVAISLFGFFLGYLLEKYNFCNIYRRPEMLNDIICKVYINFFIVCLFISGLGDYIFKNDVYETKIWPLINIITFGVLIIIPYNFIITSFSKYCINLKESKIHKTKLEDKYYEFFNNYERENPMTKKEGVSNYLKAIKNMGKIEESEFKKNIENLGNVSLMKLYYNDRKNTNNFKIQKTINNKKSLMKSFLIESIREEDYEEEIFSPNDNPTKSKDISNTIYVGNKNQNSNSNNISNNNNNNNNKKNDLIAINSSSQREFNY